LLDKESEGNFIFPSNNVVGRHRLWNC